jgi:hypothetical protein
VGDMAVARYGRQRDRVLISRLVGLNKGMAVRAVNSRSNASRRMHVSKYTESLIASSCYSVTTLQARLRPVAASVSDGPLLLSFLETLHISSVPSMTSRKQEHVIFFAPAV